MGRSWTQPNHDRHHAARMQRHAGHRAHARRRHLAHAHALPPPHAAQHIRPEAWLAVAVAFALACAMLAASVLPARGSEPAIGFRSDGDEIAGWWWLRDPMGRASATWYVHGTPTGGPIVLELALLATDRASGGPGVDARVWLTVGPLADGATGPAAWGPELVVLPNVAPPGDPLGYATAGSVTIDAGRIATDAPGIWVRIARRGPDDRALRDHVAANAGALRVTGIAGDLATPGPTLAPTPAATVRPTATPRPTPTPPSGPPDGIPTIVALGDSYIAGEGGRWAGNTNGSWTLVDALGSTAYDQPQPEGAIAGCHRSASAEVHIADNPYGPAVETINLACSGATTETRVTDDGDKPGIDRCPNEAYCPNSTLKGQATLLEGIARTHNVDLVVLSIGGNDFAFSSIVEACANDYVFSLSVDPDYCRDDAGPLGHLSDLNALLVRQRLVLAYTAVEDAMEAAGYTSGDWTLLVQTYPSPLAPGGLIRYPETGGVIRLDGGCPFWDEDADWANTVALGRIEQTIREAVAVFGRPNVRILDVSELFVGRRLCEDGVALVGSANGAADWTAADAVDRSEWVVAIHAIFSAGGLIDLPGSVYQKVESFHPNHWGQLALRSCLRQAYNNGAVRGGSCLFYLPGTNDRGEPTVRFVAD